MDFVVSVRADRQVFMEVKDVPLFRLKFLALDLQCKPQELKRIVSKLRMYVKGYIKVERLSDLQNDSP